MPPKRVAGWKQTRPLEAAQHPQKRVAGWGRGGRWEAWRRLGDGCAALAADCAGGSGAWGALRISVGRSLRSAGAPP